MKKTIVILTLCIVFLLFGCSKINETNYAVEMENTSNDNYQTIIESTTRHNALEIQKANSIQISNIEKIIFESFGTSTEIELSDEVLKDLEKSKTAVSPILDDLAVSKLGKIYVTENGEEKLFGDIFTDFKGNYYLFYLGNQYDAVVKLSLNSK